MTLLDDLRGLGLPMISHYAPQPYTDPETEQTGTAQMFLAWTTDEAKATAAQERGALIREYRSANKRFTGWEVGCRVVEWES